MSFSKKKDMDLLNGPILGKILTFVLPLIATNLLQMLYSSADMIVVGLSGVEGAIGAIGTTVAMINLIINVFMGFSVGTGVVVARRIGEGSEEETQNAVHTSMATAILFSLICVAIGMPVSRPLLAFLGDEGHILDLATLYARIYFAEVPFLSLTNFMIAIFRAKGDTSTPLVVLTLSGILNVILNLVCVLGFGMSVDGVAIATVASNVFSTIVLAVKLSHDNSWCRMSLRKIRLDKRSFKDIAVCGLPAGIQGALFSLSNMVIQSSVTQVNNTLYPGGSAIIDGNAAGNNLDSYAYTATNAIYQASITFVSQHFGAKKFERMKKVIRSCYLVTFVTATVTSLLILIFKRPLLGIYLTDQAAIEAGVIRLNYMLAVYFLLAFMEVGSGILRGLDKSLTSTAVSLFGSVVLRLLWIVFVFSKVKTLQSIYLSYPVSWAVTALMHFAIWKSVLSKDIKEHKHAAT